MLVIPDKNLEFKLEKRVLVLFFFETSSKIRDKRGKK